MIYTITPTDMLTLERRFMDETNTLAIILMEHAAIAIADALSDYSRVLFLCGSGSNGGDGLAAARLFSMNGGEAIVWLFGGNVSDAAQQQADMLGGVGVSIQRVTDIVPELPQVDCIVDALFGIGLSRPLEGIYHDVAEQTNRSGTYVVAVDIPSGVDGETGRVLGAAIRANKTITFHRPKVGQYIFPGREYVGSLVIAPIGIPLMYGLIGNPVVVLEDDDISELLPPRKINSHKGSYGHALIIAGSAGMAGAAALCAKAALRTGAGLVTLACPAAILPIVQTLVPEAMAIPAETADDIQRAMAGKTCAAVGPGLGRDAWPIIQPLFTANIPQVWDADALNILATEGSNPPTNTIITPHPGEAARLMNQSASAIADDPLVAAQALHEQIGSVVLLKGATSVITDGVSMTLNVNGSPALAKGGSGDTLTGIIAGLLAQGLSLYDAAKVGAYIHGRAGTRAADALGERSVLASDLTNYFGYDSLHYRIFREDDSRVRR